MPISRAEIKPFSYFPRMERSRQTKIIATLGPATATPEAVAALLDAGVDLFRLNLSHATHDWATQIVGRVRAAAGC